MTPQSTVLSAAGHVTATTTTLGSDGEEGESTGFANRFPRWPGQALAKTGFRVQRSPFGKGLHSVDMIPSANRYGIIFDFDGTLADTLADIADSINDAFAHENLPPVSPARVRELIGEGLRNLLGRAADLRDGKTIDRLVDGYRDAYVQRMLVKTALYPGIAPLLDTLASANVPMTVLSNKPHEFMAPLAEALLNHWPFLRCQGSTTDRPRKPDPAVALQHAEAMNRPASHTFFMGDSTVDVETAHNANMIAGAVTWGYSNKNELLSANPHFVVDNADDLLNMLAEHARPNE